MPRRQRWTPVRGTGTRVYDRADRFVLGAVDLGGRLAFHAGRALGRGRGAGAPPPAAIREVLVLRLDRMGDVLMSLPALHALRAALPQARIRLAVGRWSEPVARSAPVDEVLVWSAPWAARRGEDRDGLRELGRRARALRADRIDLALDLQGDLRAAGLMALTAARRRVGYANTGGAYLLTDVVALDETVSWVEQNRAAVRAALAAVGETVAAPARSLASAAPTPSPLTAADREGAQRLFAELGIASRRPLIGVHPSGGRAVKQWDPALWGAVAARLEGDFGATVLVTGTAADRPLAEAVARPLRVRPIDLTGRLDARETMAVIAALDLFLSPDTGTMHMACAVGTPSVTVFGPSDPVRYFSGQGPRHVVVRADLWCAPCNLIRKPPSECAGPEPPECLRLVSVDSVHAPAARLLREVGGFAPAAGAATAP
jgi:ADP-heptose:LPS heptosyltransferase